MKITKLSDKIEDDGCIIEAGFLKSFVETVRMMPILKDDGIKKITDKKQVIKRKFQIEVD